MRVHLLSVDSPRPITGTLTADCGKEVQDVRPVCLWDSQAMGQELELPLNVCKKCAGAKKQKRYTYGICERRELKREEDLYI